MNRSRARRVPAARVVAGHGADRRTANPPVAPIGPLRVDTTVATDFLVLRGFRRGRVLAFTVVAHARPDDVASAAASRFRFLARRAIDAMPALAPAGEDIESALDAFEDAAYLPASLEVVRRLDRLDRMWVGNSVLSAWAV